ncbi:putative DBH-like monooxygenase protein 2 [Pleurodeles waltl]|uniref:putative DBH-like monooxygenase protein 2 n=1 Tax=Pleurodeles waltl TaxID=8319 RepID=UPI003709A329
MYHQAVSFLFLLAFPVSQLANLRFSKVLDTEGAVLLLWDFNKTAEEITFELQARTTGWVGFGLSPSGGMAGADIVIGGVSPSSTQTYFKDYHGVGEAIPVQDATQNYNLLSLSENGTSTTMKFSRKFRTCDAFDVDITANTQRIIAAYGTSDTISYHGPSQRFLASVQLLSETPVPSPLPDPSFSYDIKMTNFSVPPAATTYGCAFLPLPQMTKKHHIYQFEPTVQSGNEALVHHILVYSCPNFTNVNIAPGSCFANRQFYACTELFTAWAIGGKAFTLPSNAGIPLSTGVGPTYVRLEVHYNNVKMLTGLVDSSGIRILYTPVVREYDVGILMTGVSPAGYSVIPPKAESFNIYSICKTDVFSQVAGEAVPDMQVFASILHTHLTGTAVQVAQYRNGTQLGFVSRDMSYDFSLQETRYLPEIKAIKVGDELQTVCTYNTSGRTTVTMGGVATTDEMCLGFLLYYPRNSISHCLSIPNYTTVSSLFGQDILRPSDLNLLPWTPENITLLQRVTKEALQDISVVQYNGSDSQNTGFIRNITDPPVTPCISPESTSPAPSTASNTPTKLPTNNGQSSSTGHLHLPLFILSVLSMIKFYF